MALGENQFAQPALLANLQCVECGWCRKHAKARCQYLQYFDLL